MPIQLIILMGAVVLAGILIIITGNKSKKERNKLSKSFYKKCYRILSSFFITQKKLSKITTKVSALSIYSLAEVQELSTKYLILTSAISIGLVAVGLFMFKDTISVLICITFAIVVDNILVDKQVDKINLKVYKALKPTISSIRQEYLRLGSVTEALASAEIEHLVKKPFDEIYSILTGINGELRLLKFYESSPFRTIQTLAGVCYNISNCGDEKDEYGMSNFVQALTMINSDINSEIQRLITLKTKFGKIEYLPLLPILIMGIIEGYFTDIMPGTALIYNGLIGYFGRAITLISCIVCYSVVTNINKETSVKQDDRTQLSVSLLSNSSIKNIIKNIIPKKKSRRKIEATLKNSLSKKSIEQLYTEKVVYAIVALVVSILISVSAVSLSRTFILSSTQQLSLISSDEMNKYSKEQILSLDNAYFARDHEWTPKEFTSKINSAMPGLTELQISDQVKRLKDKQNSLNTSYFHWYYMLICIGIACIAWFIPNIAIILRKYLVQTEAEDDFLQLQTLMAILMNTGMDTLDAIWQMCQNSRVHKDMLMYCYHGYASNPEREIARLQSKTPIIEFKRFIGKLKLTISELSLREAYSDLKVEREHVIRLREASMYNTINKKRSLCGPISVAPVALSVLTELLIPLGYLGYQQLANSMLSIRA